MFFLKKDGAKRLVVGLGNPGLGYRNTRHNIGFEAVDKICGVFCVKTYRQKFNTIYASVKSGGKRIILLKPQTFMNNSGVAVSKFAKYYGVAPEGIIVIHDDITLPFGQLKIKLGGSAGGHNGVQSVIDFLDSEDFVRLKLGVGGKQQKERNLADWVLQKFEPEEIKVADALAKLAAEAASEVLEKGASVAMNKYNAKTAKSSAK